MTKQLYDEALADVRQAKEALIADAKHDLIEALTPRLRRMVDRQLMLSVTEAVDCDDDKDILHDDAEQLDEAEGDVVNDEPADVETGTELPKTSPDSTPVSPVDIMSADDHGMFEVRLAALEENASLMEGVSNVIKESAAFRGKISKTIGELDDSYGYVQESVSDPERRATYEGRLEGVFQRLTTIQETVRKMGKQRINEEDITLKLTGLPDEGIDLENIGVDLIADDGEVASDEDGDVDADAEGDDLDLDFGGDDAGDDVPVESTELSDDTVVEIDDEMLRSEIARAKAALVEGEHPANIVDDFGDGTSKGDPLDTDPSKESPKAGEKPAHMIEAVVQRATQRVARLRKKLAEATKAGNDRMVKVIKVEIKRSEKRISEAKASAGAKNVSKGTNVSKNAVVENRTAQKPADGANANIRKQLAEANLYNAKLVHANKLLQTDALTAKQKSKVIARLDEAKTPREAKLIYDSVVKTLSKGNVNEGTNRVNGLASRVVKPAARPLNEGTSAGGFDIDRWAKIAGIK